MNHPADALDLLTRPAHPDGLPSRLQIDRLEAGELSPAEARSLRAAIDATPHGHTHLAQRRDDAARLAALLPKEAFINAVMARATEAPEAKAPAYGLLTRLMEALRRFVSTVGGPQLAALGAMAALLLIALPRIIEPGRGLTPKGAHSHAAPTMEILRLQGAEVKAMSSGTIAHRGDQLQVLIRPGGRAFVMVVNLDDRGVFTPYYATDDGQSLPIGDGPQALLPWAIDLDAFTGRERIIALLSDEALIEEDVEAAAQEWVADHHGADPLPMETLDLIPYLDPDGDIDGLTQLTFDVVKEARP